MKILVIAEHNNETVKASTFSTINAASQIDQNIDVLVVGSDCNNVTSELSNTQYIKKILLIEVLWEVILSSGVLITPLKASGFKMWSQELPTFSRIRKVTP